MHGLWLAVAFIHLVCDLVCLERHLLTLSHSVGSRVKPLFVVWTISMDSIVPAVFATGAECVRWSADFGLSVTSQLLHSLMKFLRAGRSVRLWINLDAKHSRLQEAHFPNHCRCFDAKTVTATLVSTPTISEFPWIQRGVDLQCQQSHVAVDTSSTNFWNFNDCSRTESRFRPGRVLRSCCHHINNNCVPFSERQLGVR